MIATILLASGFYLLAGIAFWYYIKQDEDNCKPGMPPCGIWVLLWPLWLCCVLFSEEEQQKIKTAYEAKRDLVITNRKRTAAEREAQIEQDYQDVLTMIEYEKYNIIPFQELDHDRG